MIEDHMMAVSHAEHAALVEERDRLKAVIDMVAESVIVSVVVLGKPKLHVETSKGCGICWGEYQGHDKPDGTGAYAHEDWCPRKTPR